MKLAPTLLLIASITNSFSAQAQTETRSATIYRCGPDGRDLRESPCPSGVPVKATQVTFDHPSAGRIQAAQSQAADAAQQADQLERQRVHREAVERRHASKASGIDGLADAPKTKPAAAPKVTEMKPPKTERSRKPRTNASGG